MPEGKKYDDIGDSEVGKPYRGKMVVHIEVELTKIDEEKCRVKRFTTLEDGFIVVEDTLKTIDHIVLEWGELPPLVIGTPFRSDKLAKGNKDNIKEKDPNSDEQQKLREKAREKLKQRGIKPADKKEEKKKPDTMQVYVKQQDGLRIPLKVTPSTTVAEIKQMVEDKKEIPVDEQHFDYEGTELEDDRRTVADYKIKKGHTIDLIPRPMKINVKKIDGTIIPVCVSPARTIEFVKKKLEEMDNLPVAEQNMEFKGKSLENSPTLQDYEIVDGDTIELQPDPIKLKIKKIDGTTFELPAFNPLKTSFADVKKMIEEAEGIPVDDQNMEFKDEPLDDDDKPIAHCGIGDGDTIELQPDPITLKLKKIDGTEFEVPNVNPLKTKLSDVKKLIEEAEGIPVDDQNLELKGQPVDDGDTLYEYEVKDGDTLCLVPDPITVNFRLPNGESAKLTNINPQKSVAEVKKLLSEQEGIPVDDQHPKFNGTPLDDNLSLLDAGVEDQDTIDLEIPITVKTIDGKDVPLMVSPFKTIEDIKKEIQSKEGIPVDDQNMEYDGKNLKNPKSLLDYKIKAGDTLELVPEPNPITLKFKKADGTTLTLNDVPPLKTIKEVKDMLNEQEGIPNDKQHWEYNEDPLDENQTVQDFGIKDGDTINLVPMEVKLKHWTGATMYLKVEPDFTLDQLRDLVEKKPPKIKKAEQNLSFNDDPLTDDKKTLSQYGIKHGDTIKTLKAPKAPKEGGDEKSGSYLTPEWREEKKKLYGEVKTTLYRTDYSGDNNESFLQGKIAEEVETIELSKGK